MNRVLHWTLHTSTALALCWFTVPGLLWSSTERSREEQVIEALRPGFEAMRERRA